MTTTIMQKREKFKNCLDFLDTMDKQITKHIKDIDIFTRTSKSNGLWCCTLLPTIFNLYLFQYSVSPIYTLTAVLSIGLLTYSILLIIFLSLSSTVLKESVYGGCVSASLISTLLIYTSLGHGLWFSLFYSASAIFMYSWLVRLSLTNFQKTFTLGEAMIVTQGIVLFIITTIFQLLSNTNETEEEMGFVSSVIYIVWTTVGLIIAALYRLTDQQRNMKSLYCILGLCAAFALIALHTILGVDIIYKLLYYIFIENNRGKLLVFWAFLVSISVIVLTIRTQLAVKASTVTRKSFHVLASLVFLSGILVDINLMIMAGGIAFGLLILLEMVDKESCIDAAITSNFKAIVKNNPSWDYLIIPGQCPAKGANALRKSKIDPISSALQSAFDVYSDEKDSGWFAVTPLYLYVGLACPLVLAPRGVTALDRLAGVLSVGVGDTAASWFGSNYGFNKWPGSNRTFEGTVFNIFSQVAMVYALLLFGFLDTKNAIIRTSFAATITGLVEAKTNQVDNLVLPLVTIIGFQLTWFLS